MINERTERLFSMFLMFLAFIALLVGLEVALAQFTAFGQQLAPQAVVEQDATQG